MRKVLFIISLILTVNLNLNGQSFTFSSDSVIFLEQLSSFLEKDRKKEGVDFIKNEFAPIWYGGYFSDFQRDKISETANFLVEKRIQPFPDFKNFLRSLNALAVSSKKDESLIFWLKSLEKILDAGVRGQFSNFLESSYNLFSENILFRSASVTWIAPSQNYQFVYDSVPKIIFNDTKLICYAKGDSSVIENTGGVYLPLSQIFIGNKGLITWQKAGISPNIVFATFNNYKINVRNSGFSIDSVSFTNNYFSKPLLGKLDDRILANTSPEKYTYPRFSSYEENLSIKNIFKNIDFHGGISFRGSRLVGFGSANQRAEIIIKMDGKPFISCRANDFAIFSDRVSSEETNVSIYLESDSITHPAVFFRFEEVSRKLSLIRGQQGLGQSPFKSTFHQLDLYFEALSWKIDEPIMDIGAMVGSTEQRALFESISFFSDDRFVGLRGIDIKHPLYEFQKITEMGRIREIHIDELGFIMKMQYERLISLVIDFVNKGFLEYNFEKKMIKFNDKLYDYIMFSEGKKDYDALSFNSIKNDGTNAQVNLLNFDIRLFGIEKITLSDSQKVSVIPSNKQITLKKNRDFSFSGIIDAGRLKFYSPRSEFDYKNFKINLEIVDSVILKCQDFEVDFRKGAAIPERRVKSILEHVRGELFIDNPTNKSGIKAKEYPTYPILNVSNNPYVFYEYDGLGSNKLVVQNGLYKKDKFYFKLEPFILDSLKNYPNTSLDFKGLFVSSGILPDLEENLKLQTDYSLGFRRDIGKEGLPLYGGKAHINNQIRMNHTGLQADGRFSYLDVTADSKRLFLLPDSLVGMVGYFENKERRSNPQFPQIKSRFSYLRYFPYEDYLTNSSAREPIKMIKDEALLVGTLKLNPEGVKAGGSIMFGEAIVDSKKFIIYHHEITADTSAFRLSSEIDKKGLSFETNNVNAHIDFEERFGEFQSNNKNNLIKMDDIRYICYMDKFKWFLDQGDIQLEASNEIQDLVMDATIDYKGSNFYSIHPDQDSLNFLALKAKYDVKKNILRCNEVSYIAVADARISPDSGKVNVRKNAKMETLQNSSIVANSITKYHNIYNATTNIFSRRSYKSQGEYDYIDENKLRQTLFFDDIFVDTTRQTVAIGKINESKSFTLNPHFEYRGNVRLEANKRELFFDGASRIKHNCDLSKSWLQFSASIDPENVFIPVFENVKSENGRPLGIGPLINNEPYENYAAFLSERNNLSDATMLNISGFLTYNSRLNEYQISNQGKLKQRNLPGNLVSIDVNTCRVNSEGQINFKVNLGQVKNTFYGKFNHKLGSNLHEYNGLFIFDFLFNEKLMEKMAETINRCPDLQSIDIEKTYIEQSFKEVLGLEESDKLISELNLSGKIRRLPSELQKTLVLGDVKFIFNNETKTFQSVGKIGILSSYKEQIFKYVNGHIELTKKRSGDELDIYLELDGGTWWYFNYSRGFMQVISSEEYFNSTIAEEKEEKRKLKTSKGETPYQYRRTTKRLKDKFVEKFQ